MVEPHAWGPGEPVDPASQVAYNPASLGASRNGNRCKTAKSGDTVFVQIGGRRAGRGQGRHPHSRGLREAEAADRGARDDQTSRGRRPHPRGARIRRHHRELRVRRRQERAGAARASHRSAQGAAPRRQGHRSEGHRHRRGFGRHARPREGCRPRRRRHLRDRRLGRGRSGQLPPLERVAGRTRPDRPQEGRDGRGVGARRGDPPQDHGHQGRREPPPHRPVTSGARGRETGRSRPAKSGPPDHRFAVCRG